MRFFSKKRPVLSRWDKLCGGLNIRDGVGLEIGPLDHPLVTKSMGDIRYVDYKSTEDLRRFYLQTSHFNPSNFVDVDHVWNGGRLRDVVGPSVSFDYVVASHVIEHTPNMIGWLKDLVSVLKPNGVLSLAIPDKRRTFDVLRTTTTTAALVVDYVRDETQPRAHHVYDYFANLVRTPEPEDTKRFAAFCAGRIDPRSFERCYTHEQAMEMARAAEAPGTFTNCHTYVFTLESFTDVINETRALGLHPLTAVGHYPATRRGAEFFVRLQAP